MRVFAIALCFGILLPSLALAVEPTVPDFLPRYYADVLTLDGKPLRLTSKAQTFGVGRASYASTDATMRLSVERLACERSNCDAMYENLLKQQNAKPASVRGTFSTVSPTEFVAGWKSGSKQYRVLVAKLPQALMTWTQTVPATRRLGSGAFSVRLLPAINRQRYDDAMGVSTVEMGRWATAIHQHARDLLDRGAIDEAVKVLKQVVTWSPYSFDAQLDLAENTEDAALARASALAVSENAESSRLTTRAARLLGRTEPDLESLPVLGYGPRGLQVVLIPLPPCDVRLVAEAGEVLSHIVDIPVRVVRLPDEWQWGKADRVFRQRDLQNLILAKAGKPVDFTGWDQERFARELLAATAKDDALTRFRIQSFLKESADKPGQYQMDRFLSKLVEAVRPWTNNDRRTVFVGVTEVDVYGANANYFFSGGRRIDGASASILSYARMQASMTYEPFESRRRLIERVAKELVPPTLGQLEIPRPTDPADPYSYSDSVERIAQKTLTLSGPTREALDQLRNP